MKLIVVSVLSLIVGVIIGTALAYKPLPAGTQQVDSIQLMDLTNKIEIAQMKLSNATNELAAANDRISKLAPVAERAMEVPVKITRRAGVTGIVYQFSNLSGKPLRFTVSFANGSVAKKFTFVADTAFPKEIGRLEGWQGASGDTVTVDSAGYDPVTQNF